MVACAALALILLGCDGSKPSTAGQDSAVPTPSNATEFNSLFADVADRLTPLIVIEDDTPRPADAEKTRKLRSCIADLEACVAFSNDHWQSMVLIAKAHQSLGEHRESLDWFVRAMKFEKANPALPKEASIEAVRLQDIGAAVEFSAEALRRRPDDPALMGNHAMNLLIAKRDEEAMAAIIEALAAAPNDPLNQRISKLIYQVIAGNRARPTRQTALP